MTYRLNLLVAALVTLVISVGAIETQAAPRAGVANPGVAADLDQSHYGPILRADGLTLDEAISRAERQHSARVVRAETSERDGRVIYVLRMLSDDGRVFVVRIDAASGASL